MRSFGILKSTVQGRINACRINFHIIHIQYHHNSRKLFQNQIRTFINSLKYASHSLLSSQTPSRPERASRPLRFLVRHARRHVELESRVPLRGVLLAPPTLHHSQLGHSLSRVLRVRTHCCGQLSAWGLSKIIGVLD